MLKTVIEKIDAT